MSTTTPSAVTGATKRQAGIWVGILIAIYAGTLVLLMNTSFGEFFLVLYVAPLLAFIMAIGQAYRNGSVALSWLITAAPFGALLTSYLVGFTQLSIASNNVLGYLVVIFFLGTTAHLLGMEIAKSREKSPPRISSQTEQRGLLVVLAVTGILFAVFYVIPLL